MIRKTTIENKDRGMAAYLKQINSHRSLISSFARRDLKAKYSQTLLGLLWAVIQPLAALLIFYVFFDRLIELDTGKMSYPVFAFSGMVVWYFFTNIINLSGNSLLLNQDLIQKIYFPKIILIISRALVSLVELMISFIILIVIMVIMKSDFHLSILAAPLAFILVLIFGLSISIWLSALSVKRRDLQHLVPYLTNYGIWLTPVFYPVTLLPEQYRDWLFYLNPIASAIELFRSFLMNTPFEWVYLISFLPVLALLISGLYFFKGKEKNMADLI